MKGVPVRVEIGPRDLKNNVATIVRRDTGKKETAPLVHIVEEVRDRFRAIHESLLEKAAISLRGRIKDCNTLDEVKENIQVGIARIAWCGERECGLSMEEAVGAGILGIPEGELGCGAGKCPVCGNETENKAIMAKTY
jgi:prolyl-tRNA synthetase